MPPLEGEVVERQRNRRGLYVNRAVQENPSVSPFGLPAFISGMIATGNHNFEKFAALCNTLSGEPRALRAGVKQWNCGCFHLKEY